MDEKKLEQLWKSDQARAFRKLQKQYSWLKRAVVIALIAIGLGSFIGLHEFRFSERTSAYNNCVSSNESRQVLRELLDRSANQPPLKTNNPELKELLEEAREANLKFVKESKSKLEDRVCKRPSRLGY